MADVLKKWPETEMEYWESIEGLGGIIWSTNHDLAHGRYESSPELEKCLTEYQTTMEKLASEVSDKFNVILPKDCPQREVGKNPPPAPEGKTYYWDWYHRMKTESQKQYLESMICSACPYCEGVEKMIGFNVPCGLWHGSLYRLDTPRVCAIIGSDMDEATFFTKMLHEHGQTALDKFTAKREKLLATPKQ